MFADFICPYCYIGQERMEQLARDYDVRPQWRPYWLHPETRLKARRSRKAPTANARARPWNGCRKWRPRKRPGFAFPTSCSAASLPLKRLNSPRSRGWRCRLPRPCTTRCGWKAKTSRECPLCRTAAAKVGLDAEEMGRALRERRYMEQTFKAVEASRNAGVTNTPTYILGRTAIKGWHYYEVFQTVMEKQGMLPKAADGGRINSLDAESLDRRLFATRIERKFYVRQSGSGKVPGSLAARQKNRATAPARHAA